MATLACRLHTDREASHIIGNTETGEQAVLCIECVVMWAFDLIQSVASDQGESTEAPLESSEDGSDPTSGQSVQTPSPKPRSRHRDGNGRTSRGRSGPRTVTVAELQAMTDEQRAEIPDDAQIEGTPEELTALGLIPAPAES